jgi:hypothetical protein
VKFEQGDFLFAPLPRDFTVVWGQSSWAHEQQKSTFLERWIAGLPLGGRIGFEDSVLLRKPTRRDDVILMRKLSRIWQSFMIPGDGWAEIIKKSGCQVIHREDLSIEMRKYCARMHSTSGNIRDYPRLERDAFAYAIELIDNGVLGYMRMIAIKSNNHGETRAF